MKTNKKLFLALIGSICFSNVLGMSEELPTSPKPATSPKLMAAESPTKNPEQLIASLCTSFASLRTSADSSSIVSLQPSQLPAFLAGARARVDGMDNDEKTNVSAKGLPAVINIPDDSEEQEKQAEIKFNLAPTFAQRIILHRYSDEQSAVFFKNIPTIVYCDEDGNLGEEIQLSLIGQQANQGIIIREKDAGTLFVYIPVYHDAYKQGLSTFIFDIKQLTPETSYQISLGYERSPEGVPTKAICSLEPIQGQETAVSVQHTIDLDPNSYII
ncbi:MAG: hypothetical protein WCW33_01580 [Candidatus Babeliales bacterium]|jgi:hypothetical protein